MIRTFTDLDRLTSFEERYRYLSLKGDVGRSTFGYDRWLNQKFYRSRQWRDIRHHVIVRDNGCDLGVEGHEIHSRVLIHHMNPIAAHDIVHGDEDTLLNPEYLVTVTHNTHNAIHYGDESLLPKAWQPRRPGDTKLW